MRRLARAYQARLNFYVINRGELPDYEGTAPAVGRPVVGAVSALRAKQPMDFTFDAHSELSPEKLKEWIDLFLAGKLKKVRPGLLCQRGAARLSLPCCGVGLPGAPVAGGAAELPHPAHRRQGAGAAPQRPGRPVPGGRQHGARRAASAWQATLPLVAPCSHLRARAGSSKRRCCWTLRARSCTTTWGRCEISPRHPLTTHTLSMALPSSKPVCRRAR